MSGSGLLPVQEAVYALLTGDATLTAKVTGVFDTVPDGQSAPYITIGDATELPFDTFGKDGHDQTLTIHIWSTSTEGYSEAYDILDTLTTLLEDTALVVAGHQTVMVNSVDVNSFREDDQRRTRHVAARFRVIVQDN